MCFNYIIFSFSPPRPAQLKKARTKRLKEIKMKAALKEIFAFFFFLICLMDVAQYHRDPNTYLLSKTLTETFVDVDAFSIPLYSVSLLFHSNYNCTCKIFTLLTVPSDVHHITVRETSLYFDVGKANCELLLPGTAQLKLMNLLFFRSWMQIPCGCGLGRHLFQDCTQKSGTTARKQKKVFLQTLRIILWVSLV